MCAVIGLFTNDFNSELSEILKELFVQSQIRGKHATGISYYEMGEVKTEVKAIPSKEFVKEFDFSKLPESLSLIGHCRYSTSDLEYNQPISHSGLSVAHNGVITQEFPEKWEEHFGYKCETKNDSELILRCIENGDEPLEVFKESSIACSMLNDSGELMFFRNGNRPLWWTIIVTEDNRSSLIVASTKDIISRTFKALGKQDLLYGINKCEKNVIYKLDFDGEMSINRLDIKSEERQLELDCSKYYKKL